MVNNVEGGMSGEPFGNGNFAEENISSHHFVQDSVVGDVLFEKIFAVANLRIDALDELTDVKKSSGTFDDFFLMQLVHHFA